MGMLYFLCSSLGAEPLVVSTKVTIEDQSGVEALDLAETSREALQNLSVEWWDVLPVMRQIETFPRFDEDIVESEAQRLLDWYIDHGWRDAVVSYTWYPYDEKVFFRAPFRKEGIQVVFQIFLGQEWQLQSLSLSGLEYKEFTLDSPISPILPTGWRRSYQQNVDADLKQQLGHLGFADPNIYWQSTLVDEKTIALQGGVEWGDVFTFGDLYIVDETGEPWDIVRVDWTGDVYDSARVELLTHRIEQLPSVAMVDMTPRIDDESHKVHLDYVAHRNTQRNVWGVGGFTTQATTWAFDGGVGWSVLNYQSPNLQFSGRHTAGYRTFPNGADFSHQGWGTAHTVETTWALFPNKGVHLLASGDGLSDLQMGFQERLLSGRVGFRWLPTEAMTVDLTSQWSQHHYRAVSSQEAIFARWFEYDQLETDVEAQSVDVHLRWFIPERTLIDWTVTPIGWINQQSFSRTHLRTEFHRTHQKWLWRNRFEFGLIRWDGQRINTLHNRFFLGGGHSLRGWSYNKVHPPGYTGEFFDVNVGGDKVLFASTELQYTLVQGYRVLTFFDVGRVWEYWDDPMTLQTLQPSVGVGFSIPTMVGDVAFMEAVGLHRDSDLLHDPNRWVFHCILVRNLGE